MNDAIEFRPAIREHVNLLVGLAGPSGGGKTMSALRLATGMAQGRPIFMIDTESGRGAHYADDFRFQYAKLAPPFSPERYQRAVEVAVKAGAAVVIVDSASHMHEGEGGVLEWHERELDRMAGDDFRRREKMTFAAWIKPKQAVNKYVNFILQQPVHFIFCFRAKDKLALIKNDKGKQEPVRVGWTPICTDRLDFEMSCTLVLPPGANGVPELGEKATKLPHQLRAIIGEGRQIDENMGAGLAAWARGGASEKPAQQRPARQPAATSARTPTSAPARSFKISLGSRKQPIVTDSIGKWQAEFVAAIDRTPPEYAANFREANAALLDDLREEFPDQVAAVCEAFERRIAGPPDDGFPGYTEAAE